MNRKVNPKIERYQLERFFDLSVDMLCIASTDGYFKRLNPAFEKTLGYSEAELLSKPFIEFIHPADRAATMTNLAILAKGTPLRDFEIRLQCKDQSYRWLSWNASALANEDVLYAVARDITAQKEAEEELRLRNTVLMTQQEASPDGILVVDETGKWVSVNQRFIELWNLDRDIVETGFSPAALQAVLHQVANPEQFLAKIQHLYQHYTEQSRDEVYLTDGRILDRYSSPAIGPEGEYYGRVWYYRDISQQKQAIQALEQSESSIRELYEITSTRDNSFETKVKRLLDMGCRQLGLDIGILARIQDDTYEVKAVHTADQSIRAGAIFSTAGTYCETTIRTQAPVGFVHAKQSAWKDHPAYQAFQLEAYLGTAVIVAGQPYGTLNFSSPLPLEKAFTPAQEDIVRLMAQWIGTEIEHQQTVAERDRFFSISLEMLCIANTDGYFKSLNPAFEQVLGYSAEELRAKPFIEFVHPDDVDPTLAELANLAGGKVTLNFENRYRCRDGSYKWLEWTATPGGDVIFAAARDITERKHTAAALQQSEEQIQAILDNVVDGIITIDSRGVIVAFNPAAERIFGYKAAEIIDQNVKTLIPEPDRSRHDTYLEAYLQTGQAKIIGIGREVVGLRRDGTTFPMELAVGELQLGQQRMFTGIVRDITERKQAEEQQLRLLKALESANRELKDFSYVVSHDLKAPLRAIGSMTNWIATDYADKLDEEGQELVDLIGSRVKRMEALINGILQYSRVGRVQEKKEAVDLAQFVPEIVDLLAPPAHIQVTVRHQLPTVVVEKTRIGQVFQNLLSNAIKFMDKAQGQIDLECVEHDGHWQFSVADNGPGIEDKYFEKIFQVFQTLTARDEFESSGIGLSIVKKIVEMHGGQIWVESTPGQGTSFFFTLPKAVEV